MPKLTLSVDKRVVERAKRHARAQGLSVSQMVERFLRAATDAPPARALPPVLRRLRGSLPEGSVEDYRRALERKYL